MPIQKKFITVSTDKLIPYENNPRINEPAVADVVESIKQCENLDPIEIDEDFVILSGHTRLLAMKQLGIQETEVVQYTGLTEEQKRKYRILANKTGEAAEWDFAKLEAELADLDFGDFDFGFDLSDGGASWFENRDKYDTSRQEGNEEYNDFLDKFEEKKTTDDCYTPDVIYEAIAKWVSNEYNVKRENMVRPFYPGGDYQNYKYKQDSVVVDNPPFSILAEIVRFYCEKGIKFFLFAPHLTLFSSSSSSSVCGLCCGVRITYENGANVSTSFLTNLEMEYRAKTCPELYKIVNDENEKNLKANKAELPIYEYCNYICTSSRLAQFSRLGIDLKIPFDESVMVRQLDAQKETGKAIFGSALMVSERVKEEKEKAEREKAERWELSERELEIVRSLEKGGEELSP